jgi:hypothetical protein
MSKGRHRGQDVTNILNIEGGGFTGVQSGEDGY